MIVRAALHLAPQISRTRLIHRQLGLPLSSSRTPTARHDSPFAVGRSFASSRSADEVMEDLQELYATAKDEFEMAAEETEKKTVYASDDRDAAKEALQQLKDAYKKSLDLSSPQVAEEIRARVSQRIRELDNAYTALEESAMED